MLSYSENEFRENRIFQLMDIMYLPRDGGPPPPPPVELRDPDVTCGRFFLSCSPRCHRLLLHHLREVHLFASPVCANTMLSNMMKILNIYV